LKKSLIVLIIIVFCVSSCKYEGFEVIQSSEATNIVSDPLEEYVEYRAPFSEYIPQIAFEATFYSIIANNPIDENFLKDEENAITTYEQTELNNKYRRIWENELNEVVKKLKERLDDNTLNNFIKMQDDWENSYNLEYYFVKEIREKTVGYGSIQPVLLGMQIVDRVRYRTLQVAEYYYLLNRDFKFVFEADNS